MLLYCSAAVSVVNVVKHRVHVRQPAKIAQSSLLLVVQKFTTDYTEYVSHTDCGILLFEAWIPVPGGRLGVAGYLTLSLVKSAVQAARCRRRGAGGAVRATSGEETTVLYERHARHGQHSSYGLGIFSSSAWII